jgi:hypothetical protein
MEIILRYPSICDLYISLFVFIPFEENVEQIFVVQGVSKTIIFEIHTQIKILLQGREG